MPIPDNKTQLDTIIANSDGFSLNADAVSWLQSNLAGSLEQGGLAGATLGSGAGAVDAVIIGAPGDPDKAIDAGRVFVVLNETPGTVGSLGGTVDQIILDGVDAGDAAGAAVAAINDLNGDGIAEFLVGAPGVDVGGEADAGRVYVAWGDTVAGGIDLADASAGNGAGYSINGEAAGDYAGAALSAISDRNGDGSQEVLVGAAGNDAGGADAGAVYVVDGKATDADVNLSDVAGGIGGFKIVGENAGDAAGAYAGRIGDQNGDGKEDILVGATGNDGAGAEAGAVYVVFDKPDGAQVNLDDVAAGIGGYKINGIAGEAIGDSVSSLGDINGDGIADILIGDGAGDKAFVVYGKNNTAGVNLADVANGIGGFAILAENAGDLANISVTGGADLNGDGINDLVIGASHNGEGGADAGAVYTVWGGANSTVDLSLIAQSMGGAKIVGAAGSQTGSQVAIAGDINNDGRADLIIGQAGIGSVATVNTPASWMPDNNVYGTNGADLIDAGYGGVHTVGDGDDNVVAASGDDTILTHGGNDTLDGGSGADSMTGGVGNDTYYVDDLGDVVNEAAGEGNDTVISTSDYALTEGSEIETLQLVGNGLIGFGNSGANHIFGTSGNDYLNGGGGADTLEGGLGNDTYAISQTGVTVTDTGGIDTIEASINMTLQAGIENLNLIGDGTVGMTGTGNDLVNAITGTDGDDILDGAAGADAVAGGAGDDTIYVDNVNDAIFELLGGGNDSVIASANYTLSANVENLTLTGAASVATGNASDNTLTAGLLAAVLNGGDGNDTLNGSAFGDTLNGGNGDDSLFGNDGNDTLNGGSGVNVLDGGLGDDTYIVNSATDTIVDAADGGNDTVVVNVDYALSAGSFIENITLGATAHAATGNENANIITGNALNNTLDGGLGADTLIGGAGDDTYLMTAAGDTIVEAVGGGVDTVVAAYDFTLGDGVENLTLTGGAHVGIGNDLDNELTGSTGADSLSGGLGNDTLDGGLGADVLAGGLGDDTYVIENPGDVVIEDAAGGFDTVIVNTDWTLADNIEAVQLIGTGHTLIGNAANNTLSGDTGDDTLDGGEGDDTELGGDGDDHLISSSGHDILAGGAGDDVYVLSGGSAHIEDFSGHDTIDASTATGNSHIDLSGDTLTEVEGQSCDLGTGGTVTSNLNVQFLQDLTGSFADDIGMVRTLIPQIVSALQSVQADSQFGVSTFRDKATGSFGGAGDWVYETLNPIAANVTALTMAYTGMIAGGGNDLPESQLEALMQLALRAQTEVGFQSNAAKFVVLFTDANFHIAGDGASAGITTPNNGDAILDGGGLGEDYPIIAQVKVALEAANIIPIFAIAGGFEAAYSALATALGRGTVVTLTANSSNVVQAIVNGLATATTTHIADAVGGVGDDTLIGNVGDNALTGNDGSDTLTGGAGNDSLLGGIGDDLLEGDDGDDLLDGGEGSDDTAVYAGLQSDYAVATLANGDIEVRNIASGEVDTLRGVEFANFGGVLVSLAGGVVVNNAPVVSAPLAGVATEDVAVVTVNALANASDADGDVLTAIVDLTTLPAGVTFDPLTNSFAIDSSNAAFQALATGQNAVATVNYAVSDGTVSTPTSVTFTVTGTNDVPVVSAALAAAATEDGAVVAVNAFANATDADGDTLSAIVDAAALPAGVTFDAVANSFAIDPSDASFQALAAGETLDITVNYAVSDGTVSTPTSVTFTVTGTNDAAVVSGVDTGAVIEDELTVVTGSVVVRDADAGQSTFVASLTPIAGAYGALTITAAGVWSYVLDNGNAAVQALDRTVSLTDTINVETADGTVHAITITIGGIEEAPAGSAMPIYGTASGETINGTAGDDVIYALDGNDVINAGDGNDYINGGFGRDFVNAGAGDDTITIGGGINGLADLSSDPVDGGTGYDTVMLEGPASNFHVVTIVSASGPIINATDLTTMQTATFANVEMLTFTDGTVYEIVPRNHAPVVFGAVSASGAEGGLATAVDALANASDADAGDVLSVVDMATLPQGISYDAVSHLFTLDPANAVFDSLSIGEIVNLSVNYGVTDGLSTIATIAHFTVTGANDAPVVSASVTAAAVEGGAPVSVSALANASDVDANDTLSVVYDPSTLPAGVTYNAATGLFTLDPSNAAYAALNTGDSVTVIVSYGISDGTVTTAATAEFTISGFTQPSGVTVTGTNRGDVLAGTAGDDFIDGRGGADTMTGFGGNDTYIVENSRDSVVEQAGDGIDTVQSSISHTLAVNVENLTLTGTGSRDGTGNDLDNVITGNSGSNKLSGGLGDDQLLGGAGSDKLYGGSGNDYLDGGTSADIMNGGQGDDIYIVDNGGDQISDSSGVDAVWTSRGQYALGSGIENLVYTGTANFTGTGNSANNTITGGAGSDVLNGGGGNDWLDGGAGFDFLRGGSGMDTFVFHAGAAGGDSVYDFSSAGAAVGDMLMFDGFGAGTIAQVGATDHYILTADVAHGGLSEEIVLTGVTNLDLGMGSNDFMFV